MTPRRALVLLIVVSAVAHATSAGLLGLGNDEAYHYLYATHPALGYYDHPPFMAWVERASLALTGLAQTTWAPRVGFIALFAGSTILLFRLTERAYGARAGFLASLALNLTGYYGLAASTFVLPDGPLLFFWLLTVDRLTVALNDPNSRKLGPWVAVGLAWGCALLSKYHAVFLPVGVGLYLILDRASRNWFFRLGPYLAVGAGALVFSPVVAWNATHGWASFLFQGGRAVGGFAPRPDLLAGAIAAQAGYLFPWIWAPLVLFLFRAPARWRGAAGFERLWLCLAVVPWSVFLLVAAFRPVLPHWGLIGLVTLFPFLGRFWEQRLEARPARTLRLLAASAAFSLLVVGFAVGEYRMGWLQRGPGGWGPLDERTDPTLDFYGWDQAAMRMKDLGLLDQPETFVFTRYWYQSAQVARALGGSRPVLCYNPEDPRGFAFWSRPDDWVGKDGILVTVGEPDGQARHYARYFASVERVADFWVERAGKPVRRIGLYRCVNQRLAYPFRRDRSTELAARPAAAVR